MSQYELIQPSVFAGGAQWMALHAYATAYTDTPANRRAIKNYVNAITVLFPCNTCREHFKEFLKQHPIDNYLSDHVRLFLWTYMAHDNATQAKGEKSPPYNETKRFYFESLLGSCSSCK